MTNGILKGTRIMCCPIFPSPSIASISVGVVLVKEAMIEFFDSLGILEHVDFFVL